MKLHNIFAVQYSNWTELENAINALETAQEKGDVFEQFVYLYLDLNRDYYQIDELYRLNDLPQKYRKNLQLEDTDYGVDGVWKLRDGTFAAYQAKFRESRQSATVRELATFWAEAAQADHKYVVANSVDLPKQANKHSYSILVDTFESLDESFFQNILLIYNDQQPKQKQFAPLKHQERMIGNILVGFEKHDRGKLIAACGSGKTLVALWATEAMGAKTVIFLAPSLALIKQTLESWSRHSKHKFLYLCVCSDKTVVTDVNADYGDYDLSEIDFPVTTDPAVISGFVQNSAEYKYIFTTYNSASVVAEALRAMSVSFDVGVFDEAHRTAGQKDSAMFSVGLTDEGIKISKRLFMTATERLVRPWIIEKAMLADRVVFSMDNEEIYGPTFDRYTFGEAISDDVISDYKIVLTAISHQEVLSMVENNDLLVTDRNSTEVLLNADNIFKQIVLTKAMREFGLNKAITFHTSIKRARSFVEGSGEQSLNLEDLMIRLWPELAARGMYFDWVDGHMPTGLRKKKLKEFEQTEFSVMSNSRCLTEGVDVPLIDSVYFVDPKTSLIDIVQACGRALRKVKGGKGPACAYFVVPIILFPQDIDINDIEETRFETLFKVVQALREQDERLADWIDGINLQIVKGDSPGGTGEGPIVIDIPKQFNLQDFSQNINLRIIEANGNLIEDAQREALQIRRSSYRKLVKPIGDMSIDAMVTKLIQPALEKFEQSESVSSQNLKINHNNISHTIRLGLIEKDNQGLYHPTSLGKEYIAGSVDFEEVMKLSMLRYDCGEDGPLFPYRVILEALVSVGKINFIEFLYGVYTLEDSTSSSVTSAIRIISDIRSKYPNILRTAVANRATILGELNRQYDADFALAEVWGSTTINNKFIYFRNHLELFDGVTCVNKELVLLEDHSS
ncbi:MAG: DEAD/DEAH box helicase family protein, partial [Kiritimatiellae bacterium]|nr:DEAD/DEAH box helicase family protein [Kiritimatiellia bacterium]